MAEGSTRFSRFLTELRSAPYVECGRGCTAKELHHAEHRLNTKFTPDLTDYLSVLGWLSLGPDEFFGLGDELPKTRDLVGATLRERSEPQFVLRPDLIAVYPVGNGDFYCARDARFGDATIYCFSHELAELGDDPVDAEYDSLEALIEETLELAWRPGE